MPIKKIIVFLILFIVISAIAYQLGEQKSASSNVSLKQEEGLFSCPYGVDGGIYKEYFKAQNEVTVVSKPQFLDKPEVIKLSKPFDKKEFEKGLWKYTSTDKGWESKEFDVDGDGKDEMIISANTASNHTPHIAMVVKNGNIIFEVEGANIWIIDVYGGQGFQLHETIDWNIGEGKITRYVNKDGGFLPIWTQKICWVNFK
jgi:hypothetical protein